MGLWQKACVNAVPSATKRSRRGVCTYGLPSAPMVSNRCWSVQYQRTLGGVPRGLAKSVSTCRERAAVVPVATDGRAARAGREPSRCCDVELDDSDT